MTSAAFAMSMWPGSPSPLGATFNGRGINFSLFFEHATKVKLCLENRSASFVGDLHWPFAGQSAGPARNAQQFAIIAKRALAVCLKLRTTRTTGV